LQTKITLPTGESATSDNIKGVLGSGDYRGTAWSFNNQTSATITWTYKYEDIEYDLVYSWKLISGSIPKEESGDYSKLGVSTSKN